jgi:hypothetical protein
MSDDDILLRAVVALERIADAQEAMVARPAPLRTAEKRLEVAIEANEKLIVSAVEESVKPKSTTEEVPEKAKTVDYGDLKEGTRVQIESDNVNNGCIGTIVAASNQWLTVTVEEGNGEKKKGETINVRKMDCKILAGDENVATVTEDTEVIDEPEVEAPATQELVVDESDLSHPGNFRFDKGAKTGMTVHNVYTSSESGKTFVMYAAFKAKHRPDWMEKCKEYLLLHGVKEHPMR